MSDDDVFNGVVETGLRSLTLLVGVFPGDLSLGRLVIYDYVIVHTDDIEHGPSALHPRTPHRAAELLVRRERIQAGLLLYQSRGLIVRKFDSDGVFFSASERAGSFLDAFRAPYVSALRQRAAWVAERFTGMDDTDLQAFVDERIGDWGTEFDSESVLWTRLERR